MVKRFKVVVAGELLWCFSFDPESVAVLSAALDPRYHHLSFFSAEERTQVCDIISDKVKTLYEQDSATTDPSSSDSTRTQPQAKKWKEETAMSFLLGVGTESDGDTPSWQDEIEQFQRESQAHHDSDALEWCRKSEMRFPTLAKLARHYLCVPATSVPAERIFLIAGLVISNKRSSLTPENADMLTFLGMGFKH